MTMTTEQLAALKSICETAIRLKDGRQDEARSNALMRFHEAFKDPATCLGLLEEVERLRAKEARCQCGAPLTPQGHTCWS